MATTQPQRSTDEDSPRAPSEGPRSAKALLDSIRHSWNLLASTHLCSLWVVLGLEIFGASVTIPVFSFFCIHELKLKASAVGAVLSAFNIAQTLGAPLFGRISDATGRRPVLLLCFFWSSCCFAGTFYVTNFQELITVRTLAGLSGGSIPVAAAMIMDSVQPKERPGILGLQGALLGAAFTCGPLSVVALLTHDLMTRRQIFLMAAFFCFLGFLVGLCILVESLPVERRRSLCGAGAGGRLGSDWSAVGVGLVCAWLARFCYACSAFSLYATYSFVIKDNFGWTDTEFGLLLVAAGIAQGLFELLLYPVLDQLLGPHPVVVTGLLIVGASYLLMPVPKVWVHILSMATFEVGQSLCEPGLVNLVGLHAPSERHMGFAQGASNGFRAMASVIGPFLAGRLYEYSPQLTFFCITGICFCGCFFVASASVCGLPEAINEKTRLLDAATQGPSTRDP